MKYIIVLITSILCLQAFGQNTFSRLYFDQYDYHDGLSMINLDNSLFIAVEKRGIVYGLVMLKVDYEGEILIEKNYQDPDTLVRWLSWPNSMALADNGNIIVGGSIGKIDTNNVSYEYHYGHIRVFDDNLDTLWVKNIYDESDLSIQYIGTGAAITSNNDYLICGQKIPTVGFYRSFISKFSGSGDFIWLHDYSIEDSDEGLQDISENEDGYIYSCGKNFIPFVNEIVYKITSTGVFDSNITESFSSYQNNLTEITNNEFVSYTQTSGGESIIFTKYDLNLDTIWTKEYTFSDGDNFTHSIEFDSNENVIACGGGYDDELATFVGFMSKLNSQGDLIWERRYSYIDTLLSVQRLYDVVETTDNGYAACGDITAVPGTGIASRLWVIKTDSMGCIIAGCDSLDNSINNLDLLDDQHWFTFGPNPVSSENGLLNVYLGSQTQINNINARELSFKITNLHGQIIKEFEAEGFGVTYMIPMNNFASGNYVLSLDDGRHVLQSSKIIIE